MQPPPEAGTAVALAAFLEATVRVATPLGLAALGETVTERSGVVNIGLEGAMLAGALAAATGALGLGGPWGGVTGALYRAAFGTTGAALTLPTFAPVAVPGLAALPIVGRAFFAQPAPTYLLFGLVPCVWYALVRTQLGLALRAAGESPAAAEAAGLRVPQLRAAATLFGGVMAGLAGGALVLAQAGTFAERMTAGRGVIAIAIVVLGRWHPVGAFLAALVFGAASALQFAFQAIGLDVPYQFFLMAPYVVTLLALAGVGGRAQAPEALGRSW